MLNIFFLFNQTLKKKKIMVKYLNIMHQYLNKYLLQLFYYFLHILCSKF